MKCTPITPTVQKSLQQALAKDSRISKIIDALIAQNARVLLVGGAVRDLLLEIPLKDLDFEVHGIALEALEKTLQQCGPVSLVGKVFGVLRVHGLDIDWAIPRSDTSGRKPEVILDPAMDIKRAFARRDLTINAMGIDVATFELIDPFDGYQDLCKKILRAPDPSFFIQDPLRLFRVMQFMGRFEMEPDEQLNAVCATMNIDNVSIERVELEFQKLMLKSRRPSLGIRWLDAIDRLQEILPELAATHGVIQDVRWHPEGDVYEHSMQALDAAALLQYEDEDKKLIMTYAGLCHDLGKVSTTEIRDGKITSYGHAQVGSKLAKRMLKRIMRTADVIEAVVKLVHHHMDAIQLVQGNAKPAAYKRLAKKLSPDVTMEQLGQLVLVDQRGRNPNGHEPLDIQDPELEIFLERTRQARVLYEVEKAVLLGRDLMDVIKPGPHMGQLLKQAYNIQIEEGIQDKQELKRRVLEKK